MALDAGFMEKLMKIPYFKDLADAHGQEWLESIFESLETRAYDFPIAPPYLSASAEGKSAPVSDEMATVATPAAMAFAQSASEKGLPDLGSELPVAAAENAVAWESASGPGVRFDNDTSLEFFSPTATDKGTHWRNALLFSAHNSDEAVKVALAGVQHLLKLSALDDKIYTFEASHDGTTTLHGGAGSDTLVLTAAGFDVELDTKTNFGRFGGKVELHGVENIVGSDGADRLTGDDGANRLVGRLGNDVISGAGGRDEIIGGGGNNDLSGGDGGDTIKGGSGTDDISGGNGNDEIEAGGGNDKISGGGGADTIGGGAGGDVVSGGAGNDDITGGAGDDKISGGAGNDMIDGGAGNDILRGGSGKDEIDGGGGEDEINGGEGDDTLNGDGGNDKISGGGGDDEIDGGAGKDEIDGGAGSDTIDGGAGNDTIDGGAGDDEIDGGDGDDVILGGAGVDSITGGDGDDTITGGAGADKITGGDGADVFVYVDEADSGTAADTFDLITGFVAADDKFDLTALLDGDTFDFLATEAAAFTGNGPEVRWDKSGGKTLIELDVDGDGTADMKIELQSEVNLTASNFNL